MSEEKKCSCGAKAEYICDCGELLCREDPCPKGCGGAVKPLMKKAMVTCRTNSAVHYIEERKPICGTKVPYGEIWETPADVTCQRCKTIFEKQKEVEKNEYNDTIVWKENEFC